MSRTDFPFKPFHQNHSEQRIHESNCGLVQTMYALSILITEKMVHIWKLAFYDFIGNMCYMESGYLQELASGCSQFSVLSVKKSVNHVVVKGVEVSSLSPPPLSY